ncbi:MAG: peptidoglycan DD-metalloendopeptidase family protein [Leptolyngbyaceae cyanobacterium RU_5_1]|nr:peptidoglycan DD-metalloendopeptidase family protein [Leptolyngbyaceae cyanobacterium RU_5_1]
MNRWTQVMNTFSFGLPLRLRSHRLTTTLLASGVGLVSVMGILSNPLQAQTPDADPLDTAPVESVPVPEADPIAPAAPLDAPVSAPELSTPSIDSAVPSGSAADFNEPYIDSVNYDTGATYRSADLPATPEFSRSQLPDVAAPQVGSLSVNSLGLGVGTTPSLRDFYRRTLRPPAQLGNGNIRLLFPLSIPAPITSLFGWRMHPILGTARFHTGTDIGAPLGTPVLAAYAGRVAIADFLGGYGLTVTLDHNQGSQQTLYGHLSEIFVKSGEVVKQGAVIGRVGSTGNSTGPHLHFEFRQLTPDGWVALDAGAQLEYALAQLVTVMEVSEKGIASAKGVQVARQGLAGVSGEIEWKGMTKDE